MRRRRSPQAVPVGNTDPFAPTPEQPVRCRARAMDPDTQFASHHHPWGQLAYCASGLLQVTVSAHATNALPTVETTSIVPPSRAVWIPPGARHAVTMLEASQLYTLYVDASVVSDVARQSRVLVVSPLLRELVLGMELPHHTGQTERQQALATLVLAELAHAPTQPLGVHMPHPQHGDRRLRAVCEAVLSAPAQHTTLADWAAHSGASERTLARLFRDELGTGFQRWRQQVVLAHALPMLARGTPVGQVAAASGYASDSAFSAMFRAALGQAPKHFSPRGATAG